MLPNSWHRELLGLSQQHQRNMKQAAEEKAAREKEAAEKKIDHRQALRDEAFAAVELRASRDNAALHDALDDQKAALDKSVDGFGAPARLPCFHLPRHFGEKPRVDEFKSRDR